jgi:hypothetical protein
MGASAVVPLGVRIGELVMAPPFYLKAPGTAMKSTQVAEELASSTKSQLEPVCKPVVINKQSVLTQIQLGSGL